MEEKERELISIEDTVDSGMFADEELSISSFESWPKQYHVGFRRPLSASLPEKPIFQRRVKEKQTEFASGKWTLTGLNSDFVKTVTNIPFERPKILMPSHNNTKETSKRLFVNFPEPIAIETPDFFKQQYEHKRKTTTSNSKDNMPAPHHLGIFQFLSFDDDTVCKEKLNSSSSACIFDKIEYLNCEGLTSHRFTDVSQIHCGKTIQHRSQMPWYRYEEYSDVGNLLELVNLYCNTFKEIIMENKDDKTTSRCFGYKLRLELYYEIRRRSQISERSISYEDIFENLYSMKHFFSIPIYELLRKGCHLNNSDSHFPVTKEAIDVTLQCIKRQLLLQKKNGHVSITKLLFCQCNSKSSSVQLLVYYRGEKRGRTPRINGIDVNWKQDGIVNNEAEIVMKQRHCFGDKFCPTDLPRVTTEVASRLFKQHSNLSMIAASKCKSTGYKRGNHTIKNDVCYQLFCKSKGFIPFAEPMFPTKIDSLDVDVLEGICYFGNDCVQMGTEIGAERQCQSGSIGGFVDLPQNATGLITCAHSLYFPSSLMNGDMETGIKVYTKTSNTFYESGHILKPVFSHGNHRQVSVDAALIQIDRPISGSFPDVPTIQIRKAGFDPQRPPQFDSGEVVTTIPNRNHRVIKYGPRTKLTCGMFTLDGLHVRMEKEKMAFSLSDNEENVSAVMYGQYGVNSNEGSFFKLGDSGSFVFTVEDDSNLRQTLKCVGMAIGIVKGPKTCIVTPIKDVLEALGLDMKLKKFNDQNDNRDNQTMTSQSLTTDEMFRMLISGNQNLESKLEAQLKKSRDEVKNEMQNFKTEINDSLNAIKEELSGLMGENAKKQSRQEGKHN